MVVGTDRPARGVTWAVATAAVFMVVPPSPPADANALWYVRENAYVISTLAFFVLVATMLWFRARTPEPSEPAVQPGQRGAAVLTTSPAPGRRRTGV
jgi:hypothetical protein